MFNQRNCADVCDNNANERCVHGRKATPCYRDIAETERRKGVVSPQFRVSCSCRHLSITCQSFTFNHNSCVALRVYVGITSICSFIRVCVHLWRYSKKVVTLHHRSVFVLHRHLLYIILALLVVVVIIVVLGSLCCCWRHCDGKNRLRRTGIFTIVFTHNCRII